MVSDLAPRFDYSSVPPWFRADARVVCVVVGPDLVILRAPVAVDCRDAHIVA